MLWQPRCLLVAEAGADAEAAAVVVGKVMVAEGVEADEVEEGAATVGGERERVGE